MMTNAPDQDNSTDSQALSSPLARAQAARYADRVLNSPKSDLDEDDEMLLAAVAEFLADGDDAMEGYHA